MHSLLSEHASRFNLRIKSLQEEHAMVPRKYMFSLLVLVDIITI